MILGVNAVSKQFGIDIVLERVTFRLDAREKVALIGRNGTGKTTLLKIITGQYEPDTGSVHLAQGAKIGYLRQESPVTPGFTVLQEAEKALEHKQALRTRLDELESQIADHPTDDDLDEYARLVEHFSESDSYSAENDLRQVLKRLGFEEEDLDRKTDSLSGGEKTRLALARILLEEPDLLILDEPTNHLDLQATEWLENWVKGYHGAILLVSHDRSFLEATCTRTLELRDHTVKDYPGDFRQYLRLRAEDEARQADLAAKQAAEIAKLDEYVRRFIGTQRTAQARGRRKMMERLIQNRVDAPQHEKGMAGGFQNVQRSGETVLSCENLAVGFSDETLYDDLNWIVRWQERWGVIGENGAGKSTLIKTVLGTHPPVSGKVTVGKRVDVGYFSQDTAILDPDDTPLKFILDEHDLTTAQARDLLGRFLFHGDDVFRPVGTLSGGEKNKLVLASLTTAQPNLLILDEPTNHLDMDSREALAQILKDYPGTLVLISHDRWLLSQVTDHTLDVRRSGPVIYLGSYPEYRQHLAQKENPTSEKSNRQKQPAVLAPPPEPKLSPYELSKEITRVRRSIEDLETAVSNQEDAIKTIEDRLGAPSPDDDVTRLSHDYQAAQDKLQQLIEAWEDENLRLHKLEDQRGPG